jgi:hypothetical protein
MPTMMIISRINIINSFIMQNSAETGSSTAINNLGYCYPNGVEIDDGDKSDESDNVDSNGYINDDYDIDDA